MQPEAAKASMHDHEVYSALRLVPGTWCVVRLDGRAFTLFTGARYRKPFDERFLEVMLHASDALLEHFGGIYAHTHSDEISIALPPEWEQFGRRLESILSVAAGVASAAFTHADGEAAHFEARVWEGATAREAAAYFRSRQEDARRGALHAWCHWALCRDGMDAGAATLELEGKGREARVELLARHDIAFDEVPAWQRHGVALYYGAQERDGYNPHTHARTKAIRRVLRRDFELPAGNAYESAVLALLDGS